MGYVRTGGMSTAARRRRRTTALVLTSLVVLLLIVFAYAIAIYQGWGPGGDGGSTDQDQVTATAPALQPADVAVNVYNAKGEPGLAGRIGAALEERGFRVSSIDNDPENATIEGSADIRHGAEGVEEATLMQQSVPGSTLVPDAREGDEIDLVLGDGFEELAPAPADTAESTADAAPSQG
ncbi:MAG: LytR C-terminal domain-containing protein [Ornithinimicrobium sp.]